MTGYPTRRLRRLRTSETLRAMLAEVRLSPKDLIAPLFIREGKGVEAESAGSRRQTPAARARNFADADTAGSGRQTPAAREGKFGEADAAGSGRQTPAATASPRAEALPISVARAETLPISDPAPPGVAAATDSQPPPDTASRL